MISRLLLPVVAFAAFAGNAIACTIPVFRYALDRWPADPFILQVPEQERAAWDSALANRSVDLLVQPDAATSAARILFPETRGSKVLKEPVTVDELPELVSSPIRQEVARRIAEGESAVFVFVGNGTDEDVSAYKLLDDRLKYLTKVSSLPEQDPTDPSSTLGPGPVLKVAFSILKLDRSDPAEKHFLSMLLAGMEEAELGAGKPIVFPIFGRGRVLAGLTGESFTERVIDDACQFLLGACSCQVKEMNPGWDLLIEFDWDVALRIAEKQRLSQPQPTPTPVAAPSATPETVVLSGSSAAPAEPSIAPAPQPEKPGRLGILVGALCVVAAGLLLFLRK